ncbi:sodium transporter HKT1-like [Pistacia vera]|uniref:sodium transporter HKT1-like n=1 Tax=Pistacia vera TaxID=55513 RepID=UPI001263A3ED|nr:sodium transporter HKT1-like [Pistacia vera]
MNNIPSFCKNLKDFCNYSSIRIASFNKSVLILVWSCFRVVIVKVHPFWIQLFYFLISSLAGYLALRFSDPRTSFRPKNFDLFFTSVSALTNSSMSTIEMEVFSHFQLIVLIVLMLIGGEVFVSWLGLYISYKFPRKHFLGNRVGSDYNIDLSSLQNANFQDQIELGLAHSSHTQNQNQIIITNTNSSEDDNEKSLIDNSIKYLFYVVLGYLLVVHVGGISLVFLYISLVQNAKEVLKNKGLHTLTFSVFLIVSTFSNSGFVPTNENMMVFNKNPGLLWVLIPQVVLGNTLYPSFLRLLIWVLKKVTNQGEFEYMLKNYKEIGYRHMLSGVYSSLLGVTAFGFIFLQFVLFCASEWNSEAMDGMNAYQKLVASLFQVVNSRHTGESVFDLSIISPAMMTLFVFMMYLPPYTSFLPRRYRKTDSKNGKLKKKGKKRFAENLILSQLSYLVISTILVCITERQKIKEDPLNFNVLNIIVEVISAYGNVGFTTGYSCKRQLHPESSCKDTWYGFVGRWSDGGKLILILVMLLGRLKKFNMNGGKAWKLE